MSKELYKKIRRTTDDQNRTNITRTKAYLNFYLHHPEIRWAFLASQVSRNAGWNMTDLKSATYRNLLSEKMARHLYMTYERANWFIFSDAFPQLLIYHYSVKYRTPVFDLLTNFQVSRFMDEEWRRFYEKKDQNRLLTALIINEQNVIQKPVIEHPHYQHAVFRRLPYLFQDRCHLNGVFFPTMQGDLYGFFIKGFTKVDRRIATGKKLASLLFHPNLHEQFFAFATSVEPDGRRREYEQFMGEKMIETNQLENLYSVIPHQNLVRRDWRNVQKVKAKWWKPERVKIKNIKRKFYRKRKLLSILAKGIRAIKKVDNP
ncbi:uncharacterized protein DUF2515 [Melghiribacillus thermohalophilus]|uniref:Uncharacterized protein DUF2515 n=1 Tax=Melghiribacillus thermohalophilus TaxID=1324956 RepID=A0A4R3N8N5_9BACI|nr:DUF2515 family protein [Melghiribacillus thermohalophilus]TCT25538.1 uncharacterized protein DUF2515 [Melghiribacillus thermohalophilus]